MRDASEEDQDRTTTNLENVNINNESESDRQLLINSKGLKLCHVYINSIRNKFDEVLELVRQNRPRLSCSDRIQVRRKTLP